MSILSNLHGESAVLYDAIIGVIVKLECADHHTAADVAHALKLAALEEQPPYWDDEDLDALAFKLWDAFISYAKAIANRSS